MQAFRGVLNFGTAFIFEEEDIPILQDHGFGAKHLKPLRIRRGSSGDCRNECIEPDLHPDTNKTQPLIMLDEEAYYLAEHRFLHLQTSNGIPVTLEQLWAVFFQNSKIFPLKYRVYSYFKNRGFVVKTGVHYGVDYAVYRLGPILSHSEFCVMIVDATEPVRLPEESAGCRDQLSWRHLSTVTRVMPDVMKMLLLCYVSTSQTRTSLETGTTPPLLSEFSATMRSNSGPATELPSHEEIQLQLQERDEVDHTILCGIGGAGKQGECKDQVVKRKGRRKSYDNTNVLRWVFGCEPVRKSALAPHAAATSPVAKVGKVAGPDVMAEERLGPTAPEGIMRVSCQDDAPKCEGSLGCDGDDAVVGLLADESVVSLDGGQLPMTSKVSSSSSSSSTAAAYEQQLEEEYAASLMPLDFSTAACLDRLVVRPVSAIVRRLQAKADSYPTAGDILNKYRKASILKKPRTERSGKKKVKARRDQTELRTKTSMSKHNQLWHVLAAPLDDEEEDGGPAMAGGANKRARVSSSSSIAGGEDSAAGPSRPTGPRGGDSTAVIKKSDGADDATRCEVDADEAGLSLAATNGSVGHRAETNKASAMCPQRISQSASNDCEGDELCEHGRLKSGCEDCGGFRRQQQAGRRLPTLQDLRGAPLLTKKQKRIIRREEGKQRKRDDAAAAGAAAGGGSNSSSSNNKNGKALSAAARLEAVRASAVAAVKAAQAAAAQAQTALKGVVSKDVQSEAAVSPTAEHHHGEISDSKPDSS